MLDVPSPGISCFSKIVLIVPGPKLRRLNDIRLLYPTISRSYVEIGVTFLALFSKAFNLALALYLI